MLSTFDDDDNLSEGPQQPRPQENNTNGEEACGCPPGNGVNQNGDDDHRGGAPDRSPQPPDIEPEDLGDCIQPGAGGSLFVPREDIDADLDAGDEIDIASMTAKKIRKPGRREWIALNIASELPTRLLNYKEQPDAIEVTPYYVAPELCAPIADELKDVRVFLYYSFPARAHGLWVVNVTVDNPWYESVQALLRQPAEFFATNAIRVVPDKKNSRYRIRWKPMPSAAQWPQKSTGELLGESLGPDRFITSPDHPIYRDLIDGSELD